MEERIYVEKEMFTFKLSMALQDIGLEARYELQDNGEEYVILTDRAGGSKRVCVSADSLAAILKDVAKAIE